MLKAVPVLRRNGLTSKWILRVALPLSLILTNTSDASAVAIDLLETRHTTTISTTVTVPNPYTSYNESRTKVSSSPISDYKYIDANTNDYPGMELPGIIIASADSGLFYVTENTSAISPDTGTYASAMTEIIFSPVANSIDAILINLLVGGDGQCMYSGGSVGLFDITSNHDIWKYEFGMVPGKGDLMDGNVSWIYGDSRTATLSIDTSFYDEHSYRLVMLANSCANGDEEWVNMDLSGLDPMNVPEPSTLILSVSGLLGWVGYGRRRRKK